jgi:hypothetical protein
MAAGLVGLGACLPDDYVETDPDRDSDSDPVTDTDTDLDTGAGEAPDPALVGDWRSAGADLSDLFAGSPFNIVRIDAAFEADGTYVVESEDQGGQIGTFSGTWSVGAGASPREITLDQSSPYTARSRGIYAVSANELTYEVVQVLPDYGNTPPSGSFGTSAGPGMSPGANVQTYRRQ